MAGGELKGNDGMTSGPTWRPLSLLSRMPPTVLTEDKDEELSLKEVLPLGLRLAPLDDDDNKDDPWVDVDVDVEVRWW